MKSSSESRPRENPPGPAAPDFSAFAPISKGEEVSEDRTCGSVDIHADRARQRLVPKDFCLVAGDGGGDLATGQALPSRVESAARASW